MGGLHATEMHSCLFHLLVMMGVLNQSDWPQKNSTNLIAIGCKGSPKEYKGLQGGHKMSMGCEEDLRGAKRSKW